jgi:hypothetical protein
VNFAEKTEKKHVQFTDKSKKNKCVPFADTVGEKTCAVYRLDERKDICRYR